MFCLLAEVVSAESGLSAALLSLIGLLGTSWVAFWKMHSASESLHAESERENRAERKESNTVITGQTKSIVLLVAAVKDLQRLMRPEKVS